MANSSKPKRGPQSQTVDNAITVLKIIARHGGEIGVTEIARQLDVYPSVASRLVATLEYHALIQQNPDTRKYHLGVGVVELGAAALRSMKLVDIARPRLEKLNEQTSETVFLMVREGMHGVYIARYDSPQRITIRSDVGQREPLHASSVGKALLSHLPEDELESILKNADLPRLTDKTITDPDELTRHLAEVRQQGFAIDDEEGEPGIRCIGAPILDYRGYPIASVSISAPAFRTPIERLLEWKDLLLESTTAISRSLGYQPDYH